MGGVLMGLFFERAKFHYSKTKYRDGAKQAPLKVLQVD